MISYYPPHLLPYLSLQPTALPSNIFRHYYLSWEDALWDILPQLGVELGDTILIPNFYCLDVIDNIKLHGYKVQLYTLDRNFQISMTNFKKIFQKTNPSVVIFFHACGITNMLTQNLSLMRQIANKSLIIDDNVHRVIDTTNIKILHDRHLIVDSIRKNIPLPGSFVYSSRNTWSKLSSPRSHSSLYKLKVLSYFFIYRTILTLGITFHSKAMIKYAHHSTLQSHDNLVGDSLEGNSGLPWVPSIHRHINISKVRALKRKQVQTYQKQLSSLVNSSLSISIPSISKPDTGELHAFPIVIDMPLANIIENALIPLNVWSKFPDCTWSKSKRVFFLPLGFHITSIDQELITSTIIKSLQKL